MTRAVQALFHVQQLGLFALEHLVDGDAGPLRHDGGDVFLCHLLAQEGSVRLQFLQLRRLDGGGLLQLGDAAEAQLGGAVQIAAALRQLGVGLRASASSFSLRSSPISCFSCCQTVFI
jgi:hypothetical protein